MTARASRASRASWGGLTEAVAGFPGCRDGRTITPQATPSLLRGLLGTVQLLEAAERLPRADACKPRAQHLRIHKQTVVAKHVRQASAVLVRGVGLRLEVHVALGQKRLEVVSGLDRERGGCIEPGADFRSVDAEQTHPEPCPDLDGVAVEDEPHGEVVSISGGKRG